MLVTVTLSRATDQAQRVVGHHLFPPCRKAVLAKASEELWPFQGCIWADHSVRLEQKWWGDVGRGVGGTGGRVTDGGVRKLGQPGWPRWRPDLQKWQRRRESSEISSGDSLRMSLRET